MQDPLTVLIEGLLYIKYSILIFILNLEYFNSIANNTWETKNSWETSFILNKVLSNLFLLLFLAWFNFFLLQMQVFAPK